MSACEETMMSQFRKGTLYTLRADPTGRFIEEDRVFGSLDELYETCLSKSHQRMINRIVLSGVDGDGVERDITFVFQSRTAR